VSAADVRLLLQVADVAREADLGEAFPVAALLCAQELVRCDAISYTDFDTGTGARFADVECPGRAGGAAPDSAGQPWPFWEHYWDCKRCSYPSVSGDHRSVTAISDFYTRREYHNTGIYSLYMRPNGIEHGLMFCLPAAGRRSRRLFFNRSRGPDFNDRDRLLLALLRPHLAEVQRDRESRRAGVHLTARQRELMRLVAAGYTNAEIARQLSVSAHTVRTHLYNIFDRLGVTNRTAAAARAFPGDARPGAP
jgi:DNA-binding CsgD family transcriptional regulator